MVQVYATFNLTTEASFWYERTHACDNIDTTAQHSPTGVGIEQRNTSKLLRAAFTTPSLAYVIA